jgi:hypothetical protein
MSLYINDVIYDYEYYYVENMNDEVYYTYTKKMELYEQHKVLKMERVLLAESIIVRQKLNELGTIKEIKANPELLELARPLIRRIKELKQLLNL